MENFSKDFYGDEFRWFLGIVEDIMDPLEMGRVRVRVFGMHSPYYKDIAVEDLPWAQVMVPANEGGVSGTGRSANGIVQGAWVFGMFLDGKHSQNPFILGSIHRFESPDGENIIPKEHR